MNPNRIKWAARRGMLELDLLLAPFAEHQYPQLSTEHQALFAELLTCEDQDLFAWLLNRQPPASPHFEPLISLILQTVAHGHVSR